MIDLKVIDDNIIQRLILKKNKVDMDDVLNKQKQLKDLKITLDKLNGERKNIATSIAKNPEFKETLLSKANEIKEQITFTQNEIDLIQNSLKEKVLSIPNIPHSDVPVGKDENENKLVKECDYTNKIQFAPKSHVELGFKIGLNIEKGVALSGSRFSVLSNKIAKLHRALTQFMLDKHVENGYIEHYVPYIVNKEVLIGTGQLPKFHEDLYQIANTEQYLIPTAEVPLTNLVVNQFLKESDLPMKLVAHTPCFRSEAGAHGKDSVGIFRQHQFDKVEMVKIVHPNESYQELDLMLTDAESILIDLELPYRVVELCTGDLGFSAAKTYDIEVWIPSQNTYREISSISNCTDFQARRIQAKFKDSKNNKHFVHTLNGSGLAVG